MSIVKKYFAKVVRHEKLIENIYTLEFKSQEKDFRFTPGQFMHIAIDKYDGVGQWPDSRCFSIQSCPNEDTLRITYAKKGTFTHRMVKELKVDSDVWLKLPYGNLFENLPSKENAVFIAGGTGITPFLSLLIHDSFREFINPKLFFGVRERKFNLYNKELNIATKINPQLKVYLYIENENGRPDIEKIIAPNNGLFFISGPPSMISYYRNELINKGIPTEKVITDNWE